MSHDDDLGGKQLCLLDDDILRRASTKGFLDHDVVPGKSCPGLSQDGLRDERLGVGGGVREAIGYIIALIGWNQERRIDDAQEMDRRGGRSQTCHEVDDALALG